MNAPQKVAIITGSTDGIGRATAHLLAREGIAVVLNGRSEDKLTGTRDSIQAEGGTCLPVKGDVTEASARIELIEKTIQRFGRIDILINNAGGSTNTRPFLELSDDDWNKTMSLNLDSGFRLIQSIIPIMSDGGGGKIINISSLAGRQHSVLAGADYVASKAGLIGLTRQLAYELGPCGITVNAVAPGVTITERIDTRWQKKSAADQDEIIAKIPLRRLGTPIEVAGPVSFLVSDAANYITGATIDVNGGFFMG